MLDDGSREDREEFRGQFGLTLEKKFGSIKVYGHRWGHKILVLETREVFDTVLLQRDTDIAALEELTEAKKPRSGKKRDWEKHIESCLIEYFGRRYE